jgi:isocitrate dehydrogenase
MRKYVVAAVLIGAFIAPAFAAMPGAGPYYVGLDTATNKCSVVTSMSPGMKRMGKYKTQAAAEKGMAGMTKCKG